MFHVFFFKHQSEVLNNKRGDGNFEYSVTPALSIKKMLNYHFIPCHYTLYRNLYYATRRRSTHTHNIIYTFKYYTSIYYARTLFHQRRLEVVL